jgi:hypothetical protein
MMMWDTQVAPQTAVQFAVYDTITDAMLASMERMERASGLPPTQQLTKWQHLMAGVVNTLGSHRERLWNFADL